MKCKRPFVFKPDINPTPQPCGQCHHCRGVNRRVWAHRILLESSSWPSNSFLTLTYNDDHLPVEEFFHKKTGEVFAPLSVSPYEHKSFIDKLRSAYRYYTGECLRYYMVGEYGDKSQRPHYHYALFNFPRCTIGAKVINKQFFPCYCGSCQLISKCWGKGNIFQGDVNSKSALYIAKYLQKHLTNSNWKRQDSYTGLTNAQKLAGRHPEFARMSNKPGIARFAVDKIASSLSNFEQEDFEIPRVLVHGSTSLPLGRYLSDKLHETLGQTLSSEEKIANFQARLHDLFDAQKDYHPTAYSLRNLHPAKALEIINAQYHVDLSKKQQLYNKENVI